MMSQTTPADACTYAGSVDGGGGRTASYWSLRCKIAGVIALVSSASVPFASQGNGAVQWCTYVLMMKNGMDQFLTRRLNHSFHACEVPEFQSPYSPRIYAEKIKLQADLDAMFYTATPPFN
jgi:hypothetical protein